MNEEQVRALARITMADGSPVYPEHKEINPATGMQKGYVVLSEEERAKGFVRPVRYSYKHAGVRPKYETRPLTQKEEELFRAFKYVAYEEYPPTDESGATGMYWTAKQLASGCGAVTTMAVNIAQTYARNPKFYGSTFCCGCGTHFPVGEGGEFVWDGTEERVGA